MEAGQEQAQLFAGGGELGERMRALDWARTPLGPVAEWPQSLKTCVRVILTSRQPMFVWWGDQMINLYNDAYRSIVGGKHPGCLARPASEVWREIWNEVGPRARSAIERNEGTYDESLHLIMERNGYPEETYYTFSYSPVPNDRGGTGGILCANTDDTQRILGARQLGLLRQLAAETSSVKRSVDVGAFAARALQGEPRDVPFALIYLENEARTALELVGSAGIERDHVHAQAVVDAEHPSVWPLTAALARSQLVIAKVPEEGTLPHGAWARPPAQVAVAPVAPSGEHGRGGVLVVGLNPMRLFDDGYRGFVELIARQISASLANAEAHEQERNRAEALAELDRAKTAFFSNVSHEFRTPLTLMIGPLEDAVNSPGQVLAPEGLDVAYRNSIRLLKLVNALLDFSRLEAGRMQAAFEPLDLAALTADLANAFRAAFERAGLTFRVDIAPLARAAYVDHDMWEKIVLNLLSNALKFTFEGEVSIALRSVAEGIELVVTDSGVGIPEHALGSVFTRFHRVQGTRARTHEGSGIGLALVSELVKLHGGSVAVASELGVGTSFRVFIPAGKEHLPAERIAVSRLQGSTATGALPYVQEVERWLPDAASQERGSTASSELPAQVERDTRGGRILVVDDNADMRDYVARLLRERFEVRAVSDGEEALRAIASELPDLVLSDVMMPNLDGFGLLRALRAMPETRSVPFIMLSARAGDESRSEGIEAGADDYLVKPFSGRELLARVATHLTLSRLRIAAERERRRLYDIFMQAPLPVAVFSGPELTCDVASPAFGQLVERPELVGQPARQALADGPSELVPILDRVRESGEPFRASELRIPTLHGGQLKDGFFNLVAQPLAGDDARRDAVVIVASDVTPQVRARNDVDQLRAAAVNASRAKDDFLSTLSHELRTPLNAIIGWTAMLRRGDMPAERTTRAMETVERNAYALLRLIEDMLDLSRIEQGKLVLSVGPVEMVKVVEAALDAVRPAAEAKGVRLQPVLDSHATIVGDPDRLQQIAWNLLSNAIKFTPKGGRVQVRLRREHSYVELVVADDGQGITSDFLPHVFDRFRQQDPSFTRRNGGVGLGLAIVRSLVEMHGGTVRAESDGAGRGATFSVRLPMAPLRADKAPKSADESVPRRTLFECPSELAGLRVLVVDDERETRELLAFLLAECEMEVTLAGEVEEAWGKLQRERFDLLVSDIGMPDQDGYALIRRLRELAPDQGGRTPALALTAYARSEDRTKALRAGFNMHLAKPIEPGELLAVLAALATGAR